MILVEIYHVFERSRCLAHHYDYYYITKTL